jgi:hypothetical protein
MFSPIMNSIFIMCGRATEQNFPSRSTLVKFNSLGDPDAQQKWITFVLTKLLEGPLSLLDKEDFDAGNDSKMAGDSIGSDDG